MSDTEGIYEPYLTLADFHPESHLVLVDYVCPMCKGVLYEPVLEQCGTLIYCRPCLEKYMTEKGCCPDGRQCSSKNIISIDFVGKLIMKQECFCKHRSKGCEWRSRLSNLKEHMETCEYQPVRCANEGCSAELNRNNKELHVSQCEFRSENCPHCDTSMSIKQMVKHISGCPKLKIACTLGCREEVEQELMMHHTSNSCINSIIKCIYKLLGCGFESNRREMDQHMKIGIDTHNLMLFEQMIGLKSKMKNVEETVKNLEDVSEENIKIMQNYMDKSTEKIVKETEKKIFAVEKEKEREKVKLTPILEEKEKENKQSKDSEKENEKGIKSSEEKKRYVKRSLPLPLPLPLADPITEFPSRMMQRKRNREASEENVINLNDCKLINIVDTEVDFNEDLDSYENFKYDTGKILKKGYKEEITFDTLDISKGVSVNVNTASCNSTLPKLEHRFAMTNNVLNGSNSEWKVIVKSIAGKWFGIGVCLKELIISNKFQFTDKNRKNFNHGTFMISSNGFTWNSANEEENNQSIPKFPIIKSGDEIGFRYFNQEGVLEIFIGSCKVVLEDVRYLKGNNLVPCVVFLSPGDEITFSEMIKF